MLSYLQCCWWCIFFSRQYMNTGMVETAPCWCDLVRYEKCARSSLYLNDAWTQLSCESFCFPVMFFDISGVWWFNLISQRYINTSMVERVRWCCDFVRCSRCGMLYFHFSTIHECEFVRIASVLMRSYWVWMMCDGSVLSLINTWTQVLCKCFCVHANFFSCEKCVTFHFRVSTIQEHKHIRNASVFRCCRLMCQVCDVSFACLNNPWTQCFSKTFYIDAILLDVNGLQCFSSKSDQYMNATIM